MHVDCEFYATVRDAVGERRLTRTFDDGATVAAALEALAEEFDALGPLLFDGGGRVRPNVNVLVDGVPIHEGDGVDTVLADGDTLIVAPGVAGG
jgi:molybdopterin synthase sulfur carrier subunit